MFNAAQSKMYRQKPRTVALVCLLMTVFAAIIVAQNASAETKSLTIPRPPEFRPRLQQDGTPQYITADSLESDFRKTSPMLTAFVHNKKIQQFIIPADDWLHDLLWMYKELIRGLGIKGEADTWDCENYSSLLNNLSTIAVWRAGYYQTRAAVGWLRVNAQKSWAGLPGVMHALMFTMTGEGIYIIEPQNGQYIRLSEYPNRAYIEEVYLF